MTPLKFNINKLWKSVAGGATILAYQSWYENVQNKKTSIEQFNNIKEIKNNLSEVQESINNVVDLNLKNKLITQNALLNENIQKIDKIHQNINEKVMNLESKEAIKSNIESYNQEINKLITNSLKKIEDIDKYLNDTNLSKKFFDDSPIWKSISDFKEYLTTLSVYELCILLNLTLSIFIFTCLISILSAFYGNFLIDKLSLEIKYPKLSNMIKLRVKLQHYYVLSNALFIILALILMTYINIVTLTLN